VKYLLDTCIVSETRKHRPNARLKDWLLSVPLTELYVSVVTLGELRKGAIAAKDLTQRKLLDSWIDNTVLREFAGRILDIDQSVADRWGRLMGDGIAKGRKPSVTDSQIAATALTHGMTMVTWNVDDFQFEGLSLVNPFDEKETVQP